MGFPQFGRYLDQPLQGADNVAEVVRAVIARGADVIKIGASERAGRADTDPRRQELSFEELQAAVREATRAGLFVAAHAHDRKGAWRGVEALEPLPSGDGPELEAAAARALSARGQTSRARAGTVRSARATALLRTRAKEQVHVGDAGRGQPVASRSSRWNSAVGALPMAPPAPASPGFHSSTAAAAFASKAGRPPRCA